MMPFSASITLVLILDWLLKGFLILSATFLADLIFRRANASLRHVLWVAGLFSLLLIPLTSGLLPTLDIPLFRIDLMGGGDGLEPSVPTSVQSSVMEWDTPAILMILYLSGILTVLSWQCIGRWYAFRLRRKSSTIDQSDLNLRLQQLQEALNIRTPVRLLRSSMASIPFSTGWLRPAIVLPEGVESWHASVQESVLIHELAHIKRNDILLRILAQAGCSLHWINPLAWYGFGRMMMEQEIACDNQVLWAGTKPSDYACNLLTFAKTRRGYLDFALTPLGRRSELKNRLMEILKPSRSRAPLPNGTLLLFLALIWVPLLPVSMINLWDIGTTKASLQLEPPTVSVRPAKMIVTKPADKAINQEKEYEKLKQQIAEKLRAMKAAGVPKEKIIQFSQDAKWKLEEYQKQKQIEMAKKASP